jgi:predicted DsbA family dithiol-disulfide isomerase
VTLRTWPALPVSLVLWDDPLSPWCLVAERRVAAALEELPGAFAPLRLEPYATRLEPRALSKADRRALARQARRAAREPEAAGLRPDLWLSPDAPVSSLPALTALVAARTQGRGREAALRAALRQAALFRGLNVARTDVLLELAERAGLDLARFAAAFAAPASAHRVREALDAARDKGVREAPALVVGDEWLVAGPRRTDEYRAILQRYVSAHLGARVEETVH